MLRLHQHAVVVEKNRFKHENTSFTKNYGIPQLTAGNKSA
jgi:hypothetical protein